MEAPAPVPRKRLPRIPIVATVVVVAVVAYFVATYLITPRAGESGATGVIRVGEQFIYSAYTGEDNAPENLFGSMTMEVPETVIFQGENLYRADYLLTFDNSTRSGNMLFDENGKLRYYTAYLQQGENAQWLTQITYYLSLNRMRVTVIYPDSAADNELDIPASATIIHHFLYLLRLEPLENGYYREFSFAGIPDATQSVAVGAMVTGEEVVETPAGSYDSWVVDTSGGYQARFWVSKEQKFVVKFAEAGNIYVLEQVRLWH